MGTVDGLLRVELNKSEDARLRLIVNELGAGLQSENAGPYPCLLHNNGPCARDLFFFHQLDSV